MSIYAVVTNGAVTNVAVAEDPAFAATMGWVLIDGITPQPGIGWSYDGTTWTAPTPPPPIEPSPADVTVATLAAQIPTYLTQAQADLTTLRGMSPADLTSQAALDIHTRVVEGWATLLPGLAALIQS